MIKKYKMTDEAYHELEHIGSSTLKAIAVSPANYIKEKIKRQTQKQKHFEVGKLFHSLILEPEIEHDIISAPKVDRRTKEGKEIYKEFEEKSPGKIVLPYDDHQNALEMAAAFKKTKVYERMFSGEGESEPAFYGEMTGMKVKTKIDRIKHIKDGVIVYDLKTTKGIPSERGWTHEVLKWGWHIQDAWYSEILRLAGLNVKAFHFVLVCKEPPYEHAVITLDQAWKDYGFQEAMRCAFLYEKCKKESHFPGQHEMSGIGSKIIEFPKWLQG